MSIKSVYIETSQNYVDGEGGGWDGGVRRWYEEVTLTWKPLPHWIQGLMYLKLCGSFYSFFSFFYLYMIFFFFFVFCIENVLDFPPSSFLLPLYSGSMANGRVWKQLSRSCVFTRCCVGDGDLGAMLSLCFPFPSAFPAISLCVAKNVCTYDTLLHVGCIPSVVPFFWGEKGGRKKRQNRKKRCSLWCCIWVSSSGLCPPGKGLAAPEREIGSWNCALCRGFLWLMWIKKGKHVWICQSHLPLPVPPPAPGAGSCLGSLWRSQLCGGPGSLPLCSSLSLLGHNQTGWTPPLPVPDGSVISFLVSLFLFQQANPLLQPPGWSCPVWAGGWGLHSGCCEDPNLFVSTRVMLHNTDPHGSVSIPTCSVRWTFVESLFL